MRVLVCGDRNWIDRLAIRRVLAVLEPETLIEGDCRGADKLAVEEAPASVETIITIPADWSKLGKAAGPIRNRKMLIAGRPDVVVVFHNSLKESRGSANMIQQAHGAGVPVLLYLGPSR